MVKWQIKQSERFQFLNFKTQWILTFFSEKFAEIYKVRNSQTWECQVQLIHYGIWSRLPTSERVSFAEGVLERSAPRAGLHRAHHSICCVGATTCQNDTNRGAKCTKERPAKIRESLLLWWRKIKNFHAGASQERAGDVIVIFIVSVGVLMSHSRSGARRWD